MIKPTLSKEEFDLLPVNQKRIAICEDVIERIDAENIIPYRGMFWNNKMPNRFTTTWDGQEVYESTTSVKDRINAESCQACAKGALFCSWVGNFNKVDWRSTYSISLEKVELLNGIVPELVEIFGRKMLDNMEAAFESESFDWHYDTKATSKYAHAFTDYNLKEIMEYIIMNHGEFPLPE